jgi:uncharacterized protein (TIGR02145 family)
MSKLEKLKELKNLFDQGVLTEEEFRQLKEKTILDDPGMHAEENSSTEVLKNSHPEHPPGKSRKPFLLMLASAGILVLFAVIFWSHFNEGDEGIYDINGNNYKTIAIGEQVWLTSNLKVTTFRNGDPIFEAKTTDEWQRAGYDDRPAWCYYNNNAARGEKYGKLYNWYTVVDSRGLCPEGWRVPSAADWNTLINYLGGQAAAIEKLKAPNVWPKNEKASNSSGFTAIPTGRRFSGIDFQFDGIDEAAIWWSTSSTMKYRAKYIMLGFGEMLRIDERSRMNGFSVRCIKDW